MGKLFRSEEMLLVELFIQSETAHATVVELGEVGMVQFEDLNPEANAFQRHFVKEVRRCEEMERKLRFLIGQVEKANLKNKADEFVPQYARPVSVREIDELDEKLTVLEEEIKHLNRNEESLRRNFMELTELKHVLEKADQMFGGRADDRSILPAESGQAFDETSVGVREPLLAGAGSKPVATSDRPPAVGYLTGIIARDKISAFERVLWRALRGNLFMRHAEVEEGILDADTDKEVMKNVFVIFSPGDQLQNKIRKICESFGATLYPSPETSAERRDLVEQVRQRMEDMRAVMGRTNSHRRTSLGNVAAQLDDWMIMVRKEKAVYFTMNRFRIDVTSKCFIAQGWCPRASEPDVRAALERAVDPKHMMVPTVLNVVPTSRTPPTFFRTNKFTHGFQTIIDAYGIASYQEVNPTVFALITFPFLFAVMFGDFGHGILMTMFAGSLVWFEKRLMNFNGGEIFDMMFGGRYIILLMGIFSIYTGLIYNDIFSKGMEIFHSGWDFHYQEVTDPISGNVTVIENVQIGEFNGHVYPFGLDVSWHGSDNFLVFTNSYKMKMSVLMGVMQMTLGIVMSLFNHRYFKRTVSIWNEFLPQLIFLQAIFGYLCITIVYKWCNSWEGRVAPSLLTMLIDMFLSPGQVEYPLYGGQSTVQVILLVVAVIAVPWMLLVKPFWLRYKHNRKTHFQPVGQEEEFNEGESDGHGHGHGEFDFGEVFIHQVIHTIEFCLGCISNTASYLRLWALSLAHAQLSVVLWDMTIGNFIAMEFGFVQIVGFFVGFGGWFALTIGILLIMEGLSAFLHALRLHWVEFNNKFYEGNGYQFQPFSFRSLLKNENSD